REWGIPLRSSRSRAVEFLERRRNWKDGVTTFSAGGAETDGACFAVHELADLWRDRGRREIPVLDEIGERECSWGSAAAGSGVECGASVSGGERVQREKGEGEDCGGAEHAGRAGAGIV